MNENYQLSKIDTTKILLSFIFIAFVFVPLIRMFLNIDKVSIEGVLSSSTFFTAIRNSLISTTTATIITIILALTVAFCLERTSINCKSFFTTVFTLPMLVPSISLGMGLTILLGNNGIITKFLNLSGGIYGLPGIIMGSILYAFPVAFIMLRDTLHYENCSPYEAAQVLGIPKYKQFLTITLPYLKKPFITSIFAIFTLIITDYGVPLMIGGKYITIPVVMYQEVIGQLNLGKGSIYGSLLLVPAVIAFIIDLLNHDNGNTSFTTTHYAVSKNLGTKIITCVVCTLCSIYMLIPVISFILLTFVKNYPHDLTLTLTNIIKTMKLNTLDYLFNSIVIATLVSIIGVAIGFLTAYLSARTKSKLSKFLHLSAMTSAAIPGIVLGLSYVLTFKGNFFYGTIIILIIVNLIHFISSPYLMIYNSLTKINNNMEAVGYTLGINRLRLIKDVFIPMCHNTLCEMFTYFFINCMMTISAVSFLTNTSNKPIALMINQFEAQMQLENAAVVSLIILCVNILIKYFFSMIKRREV